MKEGHYSSAILSFRRYVLVDAGKRRRPGRHRRSLLIAYVPKLVQALLVAQIWTTYLCVSNSMTVECGVRNDALATHQRFASASH